MTFQMVQGGNYIKGFAKHGPLHNPNAFGYFEALPIRGQDGRPRHAGGHSLQGGCLSARISWGVPWRQPALERRLLAFARDQRFELLARHGGTLIDARDPWFRPIDLQVGPDGCVYVVDWYDKRASHLDRATPGTRPTGESIESLQERRKVEPFDLSKLGSDELVALRTTGNDWYAAEGRRILAERRDPAVIPRLRQLLATDREQTLALRDLWALHVSGGLDDATALGLLEHPIAGVRRWTVRLLGDDRRMNPALRRPSCDMAGDEPDPTVRCQLASVPALGRSPTLSRSWVGWSAMTRTSAIPIIPNQTLVGVRATIAAGSPTR